MAGPPDDHGRRQRADRRVGCIRPRFRRRPDGREHRTARPDPTHGLDGTRYINGGVRSAENADLASGYANVVVLSPFVGRSGTSLGRDPDPAGQSEYLPRFPGGDLPSQAEALRKQGDRLEVITPDADEQC
jgi:hypothetical protein